MLVPPNESVDCAEVEAYVLTVVLGSGLVGFDDCYFRTAMIFFEFD